MIQAPLSLNGKKLAIADFSHVQMTMRDGMRSQLLVPFFEQEVLGVLWAQDKDSCLGVDDLALHFFVRY